MLRRPRISRFLLDLALVPATDTNPHRNLFGIGRGHRSPNFQANPEQLHLASENSALDYVYFSVHFFPGHPKVS